jgi:hypothetical protein
MTIKHNAEFERAVRIEMLRARAQLERRQLASQTAAISAGLDPSRMVASVLPGNAGQWLSRGFSLVTRYPYVLSAVLSNRRFKTVRWVSVAALAVGAWALLSGQGTDDPSED